MLPAYSPEQSLDRTRACTVPRPAPAGLGTGDAKRSKGKDCEKNRRWIGNASRGMRAFGGKVLARFGVTHN